LYGAGGAGRGTGTANGNSTVGAQGIVVLINTIFQGWDAEIPEVRTRLWPRMTADY
jgi:hypothetical protein